MKNSSSVEKRSFGLKGLSIGAALIVLLISSGCENPISGVGSNPVSPPITTAPAAPSGLNESLDFSIGYSD